MMWRPFFCIEIVFPDTFFFCDIGKTIRNRCYSYTAYLYLTHIEEAFGRGYRPVALNTTYQREILIS